MTIGMTHKFAVRWHAARRLALKDLKNYVEPKLPIGEELVLAAGWGWIIYHKDGTYTGSGSIEGYPSKYRRIISTIEGFEETFDFFNDRIEGKKR
jgi:hypothetical protein